MDGSTGHNPYKQSGVEDDQQLFVVSLVPLQLSSQQDEVIWRNVTPSSTRFCRPISLQHAKESKQLTEAEIHRVEAEISELRPLETSETVVAYKLKMIMVDGKVTNVATNTTSSQKCSMCGVTPRQVNDLELVAGLPVTYRLSSLRCWISCFECLIHISYRLGLEVWQVRAADKARYQQRKRQVQMQLKETMGLRVNEPR